MSSPAHLRGYDVRTPAIMPHSILSIALQPRAHGRSIERPAPRAVSAHSRPRAPHPAIVLGVFFLSVYLLTMGGHLDSPDEELMFQVTRSLAERGALDVGNTASPEQLALPGVDGRAYTHYSPVPSLVSVPFYELGRAGAALAAPAYREVIERFAVGLRDPIVSAIACVLLYFTAVELGFGTGVAVVLTLAFGLTTVVWPYAKYSWTEPVTGMWLLAAVLAALRAVRRPSGRSVAWAVLSSALLGLAIGTKITAVLATPAIGLYLLAAGSGSGWVRVLRAGLFGLLLALPALGLAVLNTLRFGSPLETGYYLQGYMWHPIGVAGLLFSPSKSLFLYAPLTVLGVVGLAWLAQRRLWETGMFVWLLASQLLLYGLFVVWWHGDAAWGPRYLVPVLPYIVLPAGAVLAWGSRRPRRLGGSAFGVLATVGLVVNLGGVLVDQRVSFEDLLKTADYNLIRMEEQRWSPELSPILIHWQEFFRRAAGVSQLWSASVGLVSGTYPKEPVDPSNADVAAQSELFPRWTTGDAMFQLSSRGGPAQLRLAYIDNRPVSLGGSIVHVLVDGQQVPKTAMRLLQADVPLPDGRKPWILEADLAGMTSDWGSVMVDIQSQPWQPSRDTPPSADVRQLGIQIWDLQFTSNGQQLPLHEALLPPMPVSDAQPWSYELETWFYAPPHLADIWLWYLYLSGLPRWLLLLGLLPIAGIVWSVRHLRGATVSARSAPAPRLPAR